MQLTPYTQVKQLLRGVIQIVQIFPEVEVPTLKYAFFLTIFFYFKIEN